MEDVAEVDASSKIVRTGEFHCYGEKWSGGVSDAGLPHASCDWRSPGVGHGHPAGIG